MIPEQQYLYPWLSFVYRVPQGPVGPFTIPISVYGSLILLKGPTYFDVGVPIYFDVKLHLLIFQTDQDAMSPRKLSTR